MTYSLAASLDPVPQTPHSLYASYKENAMPSTRHCTPSLSIWKRHSIVYPDVSSGGLFASPAMWSGCCCSYKNMYENARSSVRVGYNLSEEFSVKMGVHQVSCLSPLLLITVLEDISQEFHKGCPWEILYAYELVIIHESSEELQESRSSGRPTRKEKDFGSTWTKPRSWYLCPGLICFRSLAKIPVACVLWASAQISFSVVAVPVGSTRNAVVSLALWSLMPASSVNSVLYGPDQ